MTQYQRFQGEYMTDPSRFVKGVPEDILEPVQLVEESAPQELDAPDEPKQLPDGSADGAGGNADGDDGPDDGLPF
jgi:DNA helicase-2/ATP-dependent DNA helicase PcrA